MLAFSVFVLLAPNTPASVHAITNFSSLSNYSCDSELCLVAGTRNWSLLARECHSSLGHKQVISPAIFNYAMSSLLTHMQPGCPFRSSSSRMRASVLLALLLLSSGDVQSNPGPANDCIMFASLNVRLAVHKSAGLHDIINDCQLDLIALQET